METSSRRGSVALLDDGNVVATLEHEQTNAHAELLLPLIERVLADAGWPKSSLDRLGVGVGPGSFTGLRVGIALAEGLSLGLDRPLLGVGSLRAMAWGALRGRPGPACAIVDARRSEVFAAIYAANGDELCAPQALAPAALGELLGRFGAQLIVGEMARGLDLGVEHLVGPELDLPHARWVAALAATLTEDVAPPDPHYVRGIGATLPNLPPSPLAAK